MEKTAKTSFDTEHARGLIGCVRHTSRWCFIILWGSVKNPGGTRVLPTVNCRDGHTTEQIYNIINHVYWKHKQQCPKKHVACCYQQAHWGITDGWTGKTMKCCLCVCIPVHISASLHKWNTKQRDLIRYHRKLWRRHTSSCRPVFCLLTGMYNVPCWKTFSMQWFTYV